MFAGVTTNSPDVNVTVPPTTAIVCPSIIAVPLISEIVKVSLSPSVSPSKTSIVIGVSSFVITDSLSATGSSFTFVTVIAIVSVSLKGVAKLSVETTVKVSEPT